MTAFLFLVGFSAGFSLTATVLVALAVRTPDPEPVHHVCPPGCPACVVADDAVGARLDLSLWDLELQEHTS